MRGNIPGSGVLRRRRNATKRHKIKEKEKEKGVLYLMVGKEDEQHEGKKEHFIGADELDRKRRRN